MAESRIFVRGLPPSLDEKDFRKHFTKRHQVTDIKLMPARRIGYIGFNNNEDAQSAIRYYNKSFFRMSKLHVELAHGVSSRARKGINEKVDEKQQYDTSDAHSRKRKHQDLEVEPHAASDAELDQKISHVSGSESLNDIDAPELAIESSDPKVPGNGESTDADWMHSKTRRLLGLVDDDRITPETAMRTSGKSVSGLKDPQIRSVPAENKLEPQVNGRDDHTNLERPVEEYGRRLFLRNLSFEVKGEYLRELLKECGVVEEVTIPIDFKSGKGKGFAFAEMQTSEEAKTAIENLDGKTFYGRLLHVLPALGKSPDHLDDYELMSMPMKKRRVIERKRQASKSNFNWNSMYMNADAVLSSTALRLGLTKSELLDPTSSDAAVKQAQAETHTIQETKDYFQSVGVKLGSFSQSNREGSSVLVKNFKYGTSGEDLKSLFSENGSLTIQRVLLPPGGTIAILEFPNEAQARLAVSSFAYRKFNDSVLFLERAPRDLFMKPSSNEARENMLKTTKTGDRLPEHKTSALETSTLFVRNLNFSTTSERLWSEFKLFEGLISAVVKTRTDPKRPKTFLSMGYGFLEFDNVDHTKSALIAINGFNLEGHDLQVSVSHGGKDLAGERRQNDESKRREQQSTKLVIKNLPFEASKKDVRDLFRSYGHIRALRMPKKLNNSTRGYAFAQFKTPKEAENALNALKSTHILGRKLVIEHAAEDTEDPEKQIEMMQAKVGKQSDRVALQRLTDTQRKKLNVESLTETDEV